MKLSQRLREAIHLESAAIAPQTSPLIEAAREAAEQLENSMTYDLAEELVDALVAASRHYENMIRVAASNKEIKTAYEDLQDIRNRVVYALCAD